MASGEATGGDVTPCIQHPRILRPPVASIPDDLEQSPREPHHSLMRPLRPSHRHPWLLGPREVRADAVRQMPVSCVRRGR